MKFFKNICILTTACTIGSAGAKGLKTTGSTTTPTINRAPQQQRHPQKETYRQLLAELRNMKEHDVLTKDKLKYTDKIINLLYRVATSNLEEIEKDALGEAFGSYHIIGLIVPFDEASNNNSNPKTKQRVEDLMGDMEKRVTELKKQALPKQDQPQNQPEQSIETKKDTMNNFVSREVENKKDVFFGDNAQAEKIFSELYDMFDTAKFLYGNNEQTLDIFREDIYHVISDLDPTVQQQLMPLLKRSDVPLFRDIELRLEYLNS